MNPYITFLRAEWNDYVAELETQDNPPKEQNVFVAMDKDIFWEHIKAAFEAGGTIAADPKNAYSAPEQLLAYYLKEAYDR